MVSRIDRFTEAMNSPDKIVRRSTLHTLMNEMRAGNIPSPVFGNDVNNHIHTTYSFSPYSPTRAVWEAYRAGLRSAGLMDHDSICGAQEFIEAGMTAGIATTIGIECRTDFSSTPLAGQKLNNPEQHSNAYIAIHGIPHNRISAFEKFFAPYIEARSKRNMLMTDRINSLLASCGIKIDYVNDVLPLSNYHDGGTVTERHLLFSLGRKITDAFGRGERLFSFLKSDLGLIISADAAERLHEENNPYFDYDLLGVLKGEFSKAFYIDATDECPDVNEVISFSKKCRSIVAYAYLGDVTASVNGDIRPQKFEDDNLDELIVQLKELGFEAVTYMPARNTAAQLSRIIALCRKNDLLEISGEDINSPRQPFVCTTLQKNKFHHLVDATWALIGHEYAATIDNENAFFTPRTVKKYPNLNDRIHYFKTIGLRTLGKNALLPQSGEETAL